MRLPSAAVWGYLRRVSCKQHTCQDTAPAPLRMQETTTRALGEEKGLIFRMRFQSEEGRVTCCGAWPTTEAGQSWAPCCCSHNALQRQTEPGGNDDGRSANPGHGHAIEG
eukprot:1971752-Rhodomonas_salina.5